MRWAMVRWMGSAFAQIVGILLSVGLGQSCVDPNEERRKQIQDNFETICGHVNNCEGGDALASCLVERDEALAEHDLLVSAGSCGTEITERAEFYECEARCADCAIECGCPAASGYSSECQSAISSLSE